MFDVDDPRSSVAFPIVGVGASAGGLEAFTQLLQGLPPDTGLGFVLIQHLDRTHPSMLTGVLARATAMPVQQAEQGMLVEPNHVYVIAPNTDLAIRDGRLVVSPRPTDGPKSYLPVDFFLRSLAADLGRHAIGVILSGSASDGTDGLRAIQEQDGITFAQEPRSAKFSGMPRSAIDAGVVDHCMDIPQLANELVSLSRHAYEQSPEAEVEDTNEGVRDAIFARVRNAIGVDFSEFKSSTMVRRINRRMAIRSVVDLRAYLALLEAEPDEIRELYEDMLIHVTSFFRDPEVFEALRAQVFPELRKRNAEGRTVRMWVAGCSTGEEVYSLAMGFLECLGEAPMPHPIQIFGSDVSEMAIHKARAGVYSESVMRDVSDERRNRYFNKVDGGYRISKSVRDLCVFVRHDLARDPPFSKLDLVSCRNVLIYFDQALQTKVLQTLHYCLNQPGFLLLGRSESVSGFSELFSVADKANRIFMRTAAPSSLHFSARAQTDLPEGELHARRRGSLPEQSAVLAKHLDRLLLARYCPPGVLVNENLDVVLFHGQTGSYLQAAPGQPQNNLIGMARGGLLSALQATIAQAKHDMVAVRQRGVEVDQVGATMTCDVVAAPFSGLPHNKEPLFVVLFEEPGRGAAPEATPTRSPAADPSASAEQRRGDRLEHELAATQEYVHTLIEEHGRASDEFSTSNEELVSGNEELQSLNEELETAKEELQSSNEELATLNDELQNRNQEVSQANSDLLNFDLIVDMPVLTLDIERRIRRFTPKARIILNVLPSDVGRSIDDIKLNIDVPNLNQQMDEVTATNTMKETEIKDKTGRWYRMQIRPYVKTDNTVAGLTLSLVDIHGLKHLVTDAQDARAEAERANRAKDDFLATLSHELRTPLSSMLLNAQRLRNGQVVQPAELQRAGEALEQATWMQVRLIDNLLDASYIVAGKLTLDLRPIDLCEIIRASLDDVKPLADAKALVVEVVLDPACDPILADRTRVQQVVSNLLTNAIKFTPRGGQVTIVVDAGSGFARLRVTDTGIGIEAEFLPHVFARFSQKDGSITREYGGLGLGLALVRHLVELQGGTVRAESQGAGQGATFSVTFPQASAHAAAALAAPPKPGQTLDRPGRTQRYDALADLRVLFVDDDLSTREAVREVLQLTGVRVELAASAAEGMAAVTTFKPQVILCDIMMPGEDGYTFVGKLRARDAEDGGTIPALAFTALASEDERRHALAAGFQLLLAKPVDIDRLREAVLELSNLVSVPTVQDRPKSPG